MRAIYLLLPCAALACGTSMPPKELGDARTQYTMAAQGPASTHAPAQLHGAKTALADADVPRVALPERRHLLDLLVQQRLGDGRVVDFAVTVLAIAHEVDDDVAREGVALLHGSHYLTR